MKRITDGEMKTALVPLADGFEDIEAVAVIDVLRRGGVKVVTASLGDSEKVVSAHGITMFADALLTDVIDLEWDAVILPGGGQGTENLKACESLLERLRRQKSEGGLVCAICAAPTVLETAGVLDGEEVTCYPSCVKEMRRPVVCMPAVADGNVITGQGPGAAIVFALAVLSHLAGDEAAEYISEGMVVP